METYFAADGSYGLWEDFGCFIIPTDDFTEEHWLMISNASDSERSALALEIREALDREA